VAATKRERAHARQRQVEQEELRARARARRRRAAGGVAAVAVLALVGTLLVAGLAGNRSATADGSAPATAQAVTAAGACATAPAEAREGFSLPDASAAEDRTWTATVDLCIGDDETPVTLELDGTKAPQAVASFVSLARQGYFDGTSCHRLTTSGIYVLQCGDPTGTGTGGPGYSFGPIENAPADDVYPAGTLAMARVGGDGSSMGSQFFLVYQDSTIPSDAAGGYTVFGRITSGLDVVQAVADAGAAGGLSDGPPAAPVTIEGVETQ
jgi:peptidyl-prolyl cis-trans isomerase B (cyclophilin B)